MDWSAFFGGFTGTLISFVLLGIFACLVVGKWGDK